MEQEYVIGDIVTYDNKIMVIKEPRDGIHFDLFSPKEKLVYCFVDVNEIKPIKITNAILEKNGWKKSNYYGNDYTKGEFHFDGANYLHIGDYDYPLVDGPIEYVHELQHVFFGLNLYTGMSV